MISAINIEVPTGGFLVCSAPDDDLASLAGSLAAGADCLSIHLPESGLLLAAWPQFTGQGLWPNQEAAVAYDLDLSNTKALLDLADMQPDSPFDYGQLLWTLYQRYGDNFIDKLRGAFAFALWDINHNRLIVATDAYGIRPVVYAEDSKRFAVASRIKQLGLCYPKREIDPDAIYQYLFFHAICSPISIYKDIKKLEPGKGLELADGRLKTFTHYDIQYKSLDKDENYWREAIPAAVETAVANFMGDVDSDRIGCFLSGGTDSSTVVGYSSKLSGQSVKTFSIGFDDLKYNELEYARIAARHFAALQHESLLTPGHVLDLIKKLPKIYDEPFGNASVVAAYFCANLAKQHGVEVMLGGDGGDEIFGGNERYVRNLLFERYYKIPDVIRKKLFEPLLKVMPAVGPLYKAKRYVRRANMCNPKRFYSYNLLAENDNAEIFQPDFLSQVDTNCFLRKAEEYYQQAAPAHDTDRLLYLDMKFTITDNDLRKVTQMVEAAGLRVRYPFLDRDLVDFAAAIPPQLKIKPGKSRYMFKQAMQGFLPDEVILKSKHGMGLPIARWLKDDPGLNALLEDTLFKNNPEIHRYVRPDYLQKLRHLYLTQETPYYGDNLWVFLVLELWLAEQANESRVLQ